MVPISPARWNTSSAISVLIRPPNITVLATLHDTKEKMINSRTFCKRFARKKALHGQEGQRKLIMFGMIEDLLGS